MLPCLSGDACSPLKVRPPTILVCRVTGPLPGALDNEDPGVPDKRQAADLTIAGAIPVALAAGAAYTYGALCPFSCL